MANGAKYPLFRATFVDPADGRYASINDIEYPVLLSSFRAAEHYSEDVSDAEDYSREWCAKFREDLVSRAAAVLVSDTSSDQDWTFLGLFQIHDVQLSNFLTCRVGAKLASLRLK